MTDRGVPTVDLDALQRLLSGAGRRWWLVQAADTAPFAAGHIPGSLALRTPATLLGLGAGATVVGYGEDERSEAAPALTAALVGAGVDTWWFAGGLAAWAAAGHAVEGDAVEAGGVGAEPVEVEPVEAEPVEGPEPHPPVTDP